MQIQLGRNYSLFEGSQKSACQKLPEGMVRTCKAAKGVLSPPLGAGLLDPSGIDITLNQYCHIINTVGTVIADALEGVVSQ